MDYFNQRSKRLEYKRASFEDTNPWSKFFIDNDGLKYLPVDASKPPKVLAEQWIKGQLKRYDKDGYGMLSIYRKEDHQLIGMGGILNHVIAGEKVYEIAYSIIPFYWNRGYAMEIANQIKKFMIKKKATPELISIIDRENIASVKVAKKIGMIFKEATTCFGLDVYIYHIIIKA